MAEFRGQRITNAGRNLLGRALANQGKFIFTRAKMGDRKIIGNPDEATDLASPKLDMEVIDVLNENGTVKVSVRVTNQNLNEGFNTEEFGLFAKIEGDSSDILYSYATAIRPDGIPSNHLGVTLEQLHEIYLTFSSDVEATININDPLLYLTADIANKRYIQTGLVARGELKNQVQLEENSQYLARDGVWYQNIGGRRSWNNSDTPDQLLIPLTWKNIYTNMQEKTQPASNQKAGIVKFGETSGTALEGDKYPEILEKFDGIAGKKNGKFPLSSAIKGNVYLLEQTQKFYVCTQNYNGTTISVPNANFTELSVYENMNRLENLFSYQKLQNWFSFDGNASAEIFKVSTLKIIKITVETLKSDTSVNVIFPETFSETPFVTVVDNETNANTTAYTRVAIDWVKKDSVLLKGLDRGFTMLVIGKG